MSDQIRLRRICNQAFMNNLTCGAYGYCMRSIYSNSSTNAHNRIICHLWKLILIKHMLLNT